MSTANLDPSAMFDRALEYATRNLTIDKILIKLGLDPSDITYDAIFNRLLDLAVANLTFANILAMAGGILLLSTFVVRTIVLMRVLCIFSIIFFLGSAALAHSTPKFLMYLLALPINVVRLVQIRNVVKRARIAARGTVSIDWLRPYMTPRNYQNGDVLFHKGDISTEMFVTEKGKFLVTEIGVEIPPGRMLGELGFISPTNQRTQSVKCIEDGEVLTITYEKLTEIYFENSEFGYFFLRLVSGRLLQNIARLEDLVEQDNAKLQALAAAKPANYTASEPLPVLRGFAANRSMTKDQLTLPKRQENRPPGKRMFARLRKFLRNVLGTILYWIGWGFAVLALVQAIILVVITGNPLVPLFLGAVGLIVWVIAIWLKYILAGRQLRA
jgi:CRP-like cAMP-binding protein